MVEQRRLSPRRLAFAKEYARIGNGTVAAKNAGYSQQTAYSQGSRLLKDVEVQAEIERMRAKTERAETVTRAYVIAGLQDIAENGETESNRVRALELLGKTVGAFTEQVDVQHSTAGVEALQEFTVEELWALLEQQRAITDGAEA